MYMIFGSSKDVTVGPTAIMALLTAQYASKDPAFVVLLAFLSGIIIISMGLLQLGKKYFRFLIIMFPTLDF